MSYLQTPPSGLYWNDSYTSGALAATPPNGLYYRGGDIQMNFRNINTNNNQQNATDFNIETQKCHRHKLQGI